MTRGCVMKSKAIVVTHENAYIISYSVPYKIMTSN